MMHRTAFLMSVLYFIGVASAYSRSAQPEAEVQFDKLRSQVVESSVFQSKLEEVSKSAGNQDACKSKATDALMCKLLARSRPEVARIHCGAQ